MKAPKNIKNKLSWDMILRYRLIETVALWEGQVNTQHLQKAFCIGRQQASKNIQDYQKETQQKNLYYSTSAKGYQVTDSFSPAFTKGTADEYFYLLINQKYLTDCFENLHMRLPNTESIMPPMRMIRPVVLQKITQACREGLPVKITYASMNNPEPEKRIIHPHTLIYNGYRWHARAWCEKNKKYMDFVLSRVFDEPELLKKSTMTLTNDDAWNTEVELHIAADPRLTAAQKKVVAYDYGFENDCLVIRTKAALVTYFLQLYRIYPGEEKRGALEQQIVLKNENDLRQWLF